MLFCLLNNSLKVVRDIAKNNGRILFVATKKQAIEPVAEAAKRCGQYYVNFRWLGGMLTNWKTVSQSIKTLKKIDEQLASDDVGYNKKERLVLERQKNKLEQALGGIKNMGGYPDLVFIIDTNKESIALAETRKLNIPIMAILDTNCNPDNITFPIPANDDSAKTIKLICRLLSDAALAGTKENMALAGVDITKFESGEVTDISELKVAKPENSDRKPAFKAGKGKKETVVKKPEGQQDRPAHKKPAAKKPAAKKES